MAQQVPDDQQPEWQQTFSVARSPTAALDGAQAYLQGAGVLMARLNGSVSRDDDGLVARHGRVTTTIVAEAEPGGAHVSVSRHGTAPLESTRSWLYFLGLAGTILAWGLAAYNQRNPEFLSPLVTIAIFFAAVLAVVVVLYVVDRSMERQSRSLVLSLRDAMQGDPLLVLQREIQGIERTASIANGMLFYAGSIVIEFLVFTILLGRGIDDAVTLEVMRWGFGIPLAPTLLFVAIYYFAATRLHGSRMAMVERRFAVQV